MKKLDIKKIVESMRPVKDIKKPEATKVVNTKSPLGHNVRDMRQEAKDLGSYGASEYFGDSKT